MNIPLEAVQLQGLVSGIVCVHTKCFSSMCMLDGCGYLHVRVFRGWFQVRVRELHQGVLDATSRKKGQALDGIVTHLHTGDPTGG